MERNINLDIDTILNKEFNIDFKGYSPIEVDQFLDAIVQDFDTFQQIVNEKNDKITQYENTIDLLKARVLDLESKLKQAEENVANNAGVPNANNLSQVDILRRLARLESEVFNRK